MVAAALAAVPGGTIAGAVAELARSAARSRAGRSGRPRPAAAGRRPTWSSAGERRGTPWDVFSDELLARLRGWEPGVPVGWAQHNYADVKHGPQADGRWRVERLLELQRGARLAGAVRLADRGRLPVRRAPRRLDRARPRALGRRPARTPTRRTPTSFAEQVARARAQLERDGAPAGPRSGRSTRSTTATCASSRACAARCRTRRRAVSCTTRRIPPTSSGRSSRLSVCPVSAS